MFSEVYNLDTVSLRYFNVYSEDQKYGGSYSTVISAWMEKIRQNAPLRIDGDGTQSRDFIHVDDLINAFFKIIKSNLKNKIYNLGSGKETSINKIASLIGGKKIFIPEIPGETKRSCANISMICKDINWKPKIAISEGIKRLFNN